MVWGWTSWQGKLELNSKGGGQKKALLGFFINHVFVGVFQYDSGTPKHALELKNSLIFFYLHPKLVYLLRASPNAEKRKNLGFLRGRCKIKKKLK